MWVVNDVADKKAFLYYVGCGLGLNVHRPHLPNPSIQNVGF